MITIEEGNILDEKYKMICHQVNTLGIMGAGLAKQIKDKYPEIYEWYLTDCNNNTPEQLFNIGAKWGSTDSLDPIVIWNIYAQDRINGPLPRTNYIALENGFKRILDSKINGEFTSDNNTLAIPYGIGCGLAGGDWNGVVYPMIQNIFKDAPFDVVIVRYKDS